MEILDRIGKIKPPDCPGGDYGGSGACRDTPVILTLHWHGFIRERLAEIEEGTSVAFVRAGSALQLNDRWGDLLEWIWPPWAAGVGRLGRPGRQPSARPGAEFHEARSASRPSERLRAVARTGGSGRDADELLTVAARSGYLMWLFRPVRGGIWGEVADDQTLLPGGARHPPCPLEPVPPARDGPRKTVSRFGRSGDVIF